MLGTKRFTESVSFTLNYNFMRKLLCITPHFVDGELMLSPSIRG